MGKPLPSLLTLLFLPSCFIDEHVTRVAWLNRSNILYAGNDRWTSDPRVRLLINTPEEFSILITQVGLGDEGLYTCSFQTRHQPYTTQVYLIVHGESCVTMRESGEGTGRQACRLGGGISEQPALCALGHCWALPWDTSEWRMSYLTLVDFSRAGGFSSKAVEEVPVHSSVNLLSCVIETTHGWEGNSSRH